MPISYNSEIPFYRHLSILQISCDHFGSNTLPSDIVVDSSPFGKWVQVCRLEEGCCILSHVLTLYLAIQGVTLTRHSINEPRDDEVDDSAYAYPQQLQTITSRHF